jgi:hypothetical protein
MVFIVNTEHLVCYQCFVPQGGRGKHLHNIDSIVYSSTTHVQVLHHKLVMIRSATFTVQLHGSGQEYTYRFEP